MVTTDSAICSIPTKAVSWKIQTKTNGNYAMGRWKLALASLQHTRVRMLCSQQFLNTDHSYSEGVNPVTGSSETYCVADKFHVKNIKTPSDKLRTLKTVRELQGKLNSQVQEQLFAIPQECVFSELNGA